MSSSGHVRVSSPKRVIAAAVVISWMAAGLLASELQPHGPSAANMERRFNSPGRPFWLGTDELGRDVLSRTIEGIRFSLESALAVGLLAFCAGLLIGTALASNSWVAAALERVLDAVSAIPALILALALLAVHGPSQRMLVLSLSISAVPVVATAVHGSIHGTIAAEFYEAARVSGASRMRLASRHLAPHALTSAAGRLGGVLSAAVVLESTLSFLGVSSASPEASWGRMIGESQTFIVDAPWAVFAPAVALVALVLSLHTLGGAPDRDLCRADGRSRPRHPNTIRARRRS
jgi:peptide/nickel transport system permease protein